MPATPSTYRIGIDVGTYSLGMVCVLTDADGHPTGIRHPLVVHHDGNVAPWKQAKQSRRAVHGQTTRARRQKRHTRIRLTKVDEVLTALGYPTPADVIERDPHAAWVARARLAHAPVTNPTERAQLIGLAVHHMARHRGRRNPYLRVSTLLRPAAPSDLLTAAIDAANEVLAEPTPAPACGPAGGPAAAAAAALMADLGLDGPLPADATPGQVAAAVALHALPRTPAERRPVRRKKPRKGRGDAKAQQVAGILTTTLMQADHAAELLRIARVQGLPAGHTTKLIETVFHMASPRSAAAALAGRDPLPGQQSLPRAHRASTAFQRYRIATVIANLRLTDTPDGPRRRLSLLELAGLFDYLDQAHLEAPTWDDVAEQLGVPRIHLHGTATTNADGDSSPNRPPFNGTTTTIVKAKKKIPTLAAWWADASDSDRDALLSAIIDGTEISEADDVADPAIRLIGSLAEDELAALDSLDLPSGRAAYSHDTLTRITTRILDNGCDLTEARIAEFDVPTDWRPPAPPINERIGHPTVDIILTHVARYLQAATADLGTPEAVVIEHVRDAFASAEKSAAYQRENAARRAANDRDRALLIEQGIERPTRSDLRRHQAITRQNGACAYCGSTITLRASELDHIVPRSGPGSTNITANLVAACTPCNGEKNDRLFTDWIKTTTRPVTLEATLERIKHWNVTHVRGRAAARFRRDVTTRLRRTKLDPELDARSLESVAYMARELRARISHHYSTHDAAPDVRVFRGEITASARAAAGIDGRVNLLRAPAPQGQRPTLPGKSRFDRRHHAVDAAVIAMMRPSVATTLAARNAMRAANQLNTRLHPDWADYTGQDAAARVLWDRWRTDMDTLLDHVNTALDQDRIPVDVPRRLRLSGQAHEDTVNAFTDIRTVADAFTPADIDRASTPALWCALTRHPDYHPTHGLPTDPDRRIRHHGSTLPPDHPIRLFPTHSAFLTVNDGFSSMSNSIHHARVYSYPDRRRTKYAILRVFATDLRRERGDLFTTHLPPHAISRRTAVPALRKALDDGTATYLGWLVTGDELLLDATKVGGLGADLLQAYPGVQHWAVDGFPTPDRLRLRPSSLASEGLEGAHQPVALDTILKGRGWYIASSKVLAARPVVIRRDALGRPRLTSQAHLPTTWEIPGETDDLTLFSSTA